MKNILIAAMIAITLYSPAKAETMSETQLCTIASELAKTVMLKRQEGVLMSAMLVALDKVEQNPFSDLSKKLVIAAYEKPRYSTEDFKNRAIIDFANESMSICMATVK